jgi:hypothetical protein
LRTLAGGLALGVSLLPVTEWAWAATSSASAPTASVTVAKDGAGWMARQMLANGGDIAPAATPDPTDTAYAVLGLHATGVGKVAASHAIAFLETQLGAISAGGSDDPGVLGEFILAAHASGVNPRQFGGTTAANDLASRLLATQQTSGSNVGLFGSQDPTYNGAFRQGLALMALKVAGIPASKSTVAQGIAWLEQQQCSTGLWEAYRANPATPCPAPDPTTFTGPDTNSTALAVEGLAAYGAHPLKASVVQQLRAVQSSDGGFPYIAAGGQSSDPDSTALVIQTLLDEGQNPGSASWTVSGSTPYTALASYQLGCSAPAANRGAFFYPGSTNPSVIATVQAVPAAAGQTLPVGATLLSPTNPTVTC